MKILAAVALTNFYLLGVMCVLQLVVYPAFGNVSRGEFPAYYSAFTSRIPAPVVIPEFLALLSIVPLLFMDAPVPKWSVWATLAAGVVYMAITFGLHLPVHRALAAGDNSKDAIAALVRTNGYRTIVQLAKCGLVVWVLAR